MLATSNPQEWADGAPDVDLARMVEARMPSEEKWYAFTGRVVDHRWKQTATFTSRLRMPAETTSERLAPRFRLAQGGARFGKEDGNSNT